MQINVIKHECIDETQEFLLKKLGDAVFVFDPYVFSNIVTPHTKVDLSFLCTLRDLVVDVVKNAKRVPNAFLLVLIMFWNKADYLIKRLELHTNEVARLLCADARMPKYGASKFGQPYRGKLVTTFMDELVNAFCREVLNPWLVEAVRTYSLRIEKRHANT